MAYLLRAICVQMFVEMSELAFMFESQHFLVEGACFRSASQLTRLSTQTCSDTKSHCSVCCSKQIRDAKKHG